MDIIAKFGERLDELMDENELSVEKLSGDLKLSSSNIYNWRSKKATSKPTISNLIALADYFSCSIEFLLGIDAENYLKNPKPSALFSRHFRKAVEAKGFSLYKLGKLTNMNTGQYYKWINSESEPSIDSLLLIAKTIDCTVDYLVGRE